MKGIPLRTETIKMDFFSKYYDEIHDLSNQKES